MLGTHSHRRHCDSQLDSRPNCVKCYQKYIEEEEINLHWGDQ